jgi:predicted nuclease of predicted toxin-antitoxin system
VRIIADESVDGRIVDRLRLAGHDVLAIADSAPSTPDDLVLAKANTVGVLLLTADKDFGELVFRRRMAHCGVMLLRQAGLSVDIRADAILIVLVSHATELTAAFTVMAPESVRIRRPPHAGA